jgi:hypothetical protein
MGHEEQLDRLMFKDKPGMGLRIQSGMGGCIYGVMAIVDGRKEGEVVVERDEEGMPLKDQTGLDPRQDESGRPDGFERRVKERERQLWRTVYDGQSRPIREAAD